MIYAVSDQIDARMSSFSVINDGLSNHSGTFFENHHFDGGLVGRVICLGTRTWNAEADEMEEITDLMASLVIPSDDEMTNDVIDEVPNREQLMAMLSSSSISPDDEIEAMLQDQQLNEKGRKWTMMELCNAPGIEDSDVEEDEGDTQVFDDISDLGSWVDEARFEKEKAMLSSASTESGNDWKTLDIHVATETRTTYVNQVDSDDTTTFIQVPLSEVSHAMMEVPSDKEVPTCVACSTDTIQDVVNQEVFGSHDPLGQTKRRNRTRRRTRRKYVKIKEIGSRQATDIDEVKSRSEPAPGVVVESNREQEEVDVYEFSNVKKRSRGRRRRDRKHGSAWDSNSRSPDVEDTHCQTSTHGSGWEGFLPGPHWDGNLAGSDESYVTRIVRADGGHVHLQQGPDGDKVAIIVFYNVVDDS